MDGAATLQPRDTGAGGGPHPSSEAHSPLTPGSAQQPLFQADHDIYAEKIEVQDFQVVPGVPSPKHYPGRAVNIDATLHNLGTKPIAAPFDVLMVIVDDPAETDIQYETHLRLTVATLASGGSVTLTFNWLPPERAPRDAEWDYAQDGSHSFGIRVISLLENDGNSSNNFVTGTVDIHFPNFALDITNRVWTSGTITDTPLMLFADIGQQFRLEFTFNETLSTATDYVKVELYDLPAGWSLMPGTLPDYVDARIDHGATLSPTVLISRNNLEARVGIDYRVNIRAISLFSPLVEDTYTFTVNIRHSPGAEFIMPADVVLMPGTHIVEVQIKNSGNGPDMFELSTYPFPASKDWSSEVYSGKFTTVLQPEETSAVTIQVKVPVLRKGSGKSIVVSACSVQSETYTTGDDYRFKVIVDQFSSASLRLADDAAAPIHILPGDETAFEVILKNGGNFKDPSVTAEVEDVPQGWQVVLDTSQIPKGGLTFGSEIDVGVLVKAPTVVAAGTYTVSLAGIAGSPPEVHDILQIPVKVNRVGNVALAVQPSSQSVNAGGTLHYHIFVKNTGNEADVFYMTFEPESAGMDDWDIKFSQDSLDLEPNATGECVLTVSAPFDAVADTDLNTVQERDGYSIAVTASSLNSPAVVGRASAVTHVNSFFDFTVNTNTRTRPALCGVSDPVPYILSIENRGNIRDTYELQYDGGYDWARLLTRYSTVPAGNTNSVKFEAVPPDDLPEGEYELVILIRSTGEPDKVKELTFTLAVGVLRMEITRVLVNGRESTGSGPTRIDAGSTVLLTAVIASTGSLPFDNESFGELLVNFFDGRTTVGEGYVHYLPAGGDMELSIRWTAPLLDTDAAVFVNLDPFEDLPFSNRVNHTRTVEFMIETEELGEDPGRGPAPADLAVPVLVIIIIALVQIFALAFIRRARRSRLRAGYTEDGEYRPYADTWPDTGPLLKCISALDKLSRTSSVRTTKPVIRTVPLLSTKPVLKRKYKNDPVP